MKYFADYSQHIGDDPDGFFKTTLFQSKHMVLGVDCLASDQSLPSRTHHRDKFYFVIEGRGSFTIGEETQELGSGQAAWAPAGVTHSIINSSSERLVMLIGIAPWREPTE